MSNKTPFYNFYHRNNTGACFHRKRPYEQIAEKNNFTILSKYIWKRNSQEYCILLLPPGSCGGAQKKKVLEAIKTADEHHVDQLIIYTGETDGAPNEISRMSDEISRLQHHCQCTTIDINDICHQLNFTIE